MAFPLPVTFLNYCPPTYSILVPPASFWFLGHTRHACTIGIWTYCSFCLHTLLCIFTWLVASSSTSLSLFVTFLLSLLLSNLKLKTHLSLHSLYSFLDLCFLYSTSHIYYTIYFTYFIYLYSS